MIYSLVCIHFWGDGGFLYVFCLCARVGVLVVCVSRFDELFYYFVTIFSCEIVLNL